MMEEAVPVGVRLLRRSRIFRLGASSEERCELARLEIRIDPLRVDQGFAVWDPLVSLSAVLVQSGDLGWPDLAGFLLRDDLLHAPLRSQIASFQVRIDLRLDIRRK